MERIIWLLAVLLWPGKLLFGQQIVLNIDSCYAIAARNYPLAKQQLLIESNKLYALQNASKGNYPQFSVGGQATYQSDVTSLPFSLPNIDVPKMSKDQYKVFGELNQPLTEVFNVNMQKELIAKNAALEAQKLEVELYKLKENITQLYFGILLSDEQLQQIVLLEKDIQTGKDKTQVAIDNGIALKTSLYLLEAELLKIEQKRSELTMSRKAAANMLSLYLGLPIDENVVLEKPVMPILSEQISRPELRMFEAQKISLEAQKDLLRVKNIPRLSFFLQGGYGRPALNMLNNNFDFYYLGGLRLNWNLSGFYTLKTDRAIIGQSQRAVDVQKDVFLFNISVALAQKKSEIEKMELLIKGDEELMALREKIKTIAQTQLENGVMTANDYILHVNAADQAKQNLLLHQMQLLMNQYNYLITSGNGN